jgi:hypothetical protein
MKTLNNASKILFAAALMASLAACKKNDTTSTTGTGETSATAPSNATGTSGTTGATGTGQGGGRGMGPRSMTVTSVRMISESCS